MQERVGTLLGCILMLGIIGLFLFDSVPVVILLLGNPFGVTGLAIGIAAIAVMGITHRTPLTLTPATLTIAGTGVLLYRLFLFIFQYSISGTWALPRYLPALWFTVTSAVGCGILIGVVLPFALFVLVSAGFRFLGEED